MDPLKPQHPQMAYGLLLVLLVLLIALWNPSLRIRTAPIDLILLWDASVSVEPRSAAAFWQRLQTACNKLPEGSRLTLLRFADRPVVETPWIEVEPANCAALFSTPVPPSIHHIEPNSTALRSALQTAMQTVVAGRSSAILLFSDGVDTPGQRLVGPLLDQQNSRLKIFFQRADTRLRDMALSIESMNAPLDFNPRVRLPISLAVTSTSAADARLELQVNQVTVAERELNLPAGARRVYRFDLAAVDTPALRLDARLVDRGQRLIDQQQRVLTRRPGQQLLVIGSPASAASGDFAGLASWQVSHRNPREIPPGEGFFDRFSVVVLNDTSAESLGVQQTINLARAVREQATGLLVVGGANSFGSGAYRRSRLEQLLPVIAEPPAPKSAASIVFLLDKSGSMASNTRRDTSRLEDALAALGYSARSLLPGDRFGLIAFDRDAEVLLPLQPHSEPQTALDQSWSLDASGGTLLQPALLQALDLLDQGASSGRLIFLLTDGFVDQLKLELLTKRLRDSAVRLVVLAIGENEALEQLGALTAVNDGRLLHVDQSAQLPRLLREQLEQQRPTWIDATTEINSLAKLPFRAGETTAWRAIEGYQSTRARPASRVYLATPRGEPILATDLYGAGQVAALPGGLLQDGADRSILPDLLAWLSARRSHPRLDVSFEENTRQLNLQVDAIDTRGDWLQAAPASLQIQSDTGFQQLVEAEQTAPGRFQASVEVPRAGYYLARIDVGDASVTRPVHISSDADNRVRHPAPWLEQALDAGVIQPWQAASLDQLQNNTRAAQALRPWLIGLALVGYLVLVGYERRAALWDFKRLFARRKP